MIAAVTAAGAAALLCGLAVLLLRKKKISKTWGASLLACALILGCVGGTGIARQLRTRTEEYSYIYLALRYLEQGQTDPAALYLKRAANRSGYQLTAAQTLLEQVRGNGTVARLRLDVLKNMDGGEARDSAVTRLQTWEQMEDGLQNVTAALRAQLPLSEGKRLALDQTFAMETGSWSGGAEPDPGDALLLQINQSLQYQSWSGALSAAVQLVEENPSASNRLLLAEVIADTTYSGQTMQTYQFQTGGEPPKTDTQARESEKLMERYERMADDLAVLEQELLIADESKKDALADECAKLSEEAEEVRLQARNIFALRALNSIADIRSLEAQVVRAKLYFAMRSTQEAVDLLRRAADSVQALLSGNRPLVNGLRLVKQVYQTEGVTGVETPEFREEMQILLGSVHPELIQLSLTPLASGFTDRIISDQKEYGAGLYVVGLDASAYPKIRVRLGGQAEDIEAVISKERVAVTDTRTTVDSYEVEYTEAGSGLNSICFVVDTSGSMGGAPIEDAREALNQFLSQVSGTTELALVEFSSSASTLVDLTPSASSMKTAVNALGSGGGTDITAGIAESTAVLRNAKGARTMILMTDGQSDLDLDVVQEAADQGITIFTIGFGGAEDELLQTIADMTGGQYIRADSSTELINVYSSLQGIVGNTVTVTYTVENTEEETRYFFLINEDRNRSVRREYTIEAEEEIEEEPAVALTSGPVFQTRDYLDRLLQQTEENPTFRASYNGSGLDTVTAAYAGDAPCHIANQNQSYLQLDVPASLPDGIYEIRLTAQDGRIYAFPEMLAVGSRVNARNFRAGSLRLTAGQALWLDTDGLILGGGVRLSEALVAEDDVNTLSLRLDGLLKFAPGILPGMPEDPMPDPLDLGDAGTAQGRGVLRIDRDDRAYAGYVNPVVLEGPFQLDYAVDQSQIAAVEEGLP